MDWRLVGLVALALTAGCGDVLGGDRTEDAFTPAPVPESGDVTEAGTEDRTHPLPGVGPDGVTDVARLAEAHEAAVAERSYRWHYRQSSETLRPNRTVPIDRARTLLVENERRYWYSTDSRSVDVHESRSYFGNFTEYADGDRRYQRYVGGQGWTHDVAPSTDVTQRYGGEATEAVLRFLDVDAATVSARAESGTYRVVGVTDQVTGIGAVEEYRARAVVTRAGFVRSLNATFVAPERQRRYAFEFAYTRVGTAAVTAPRWATERWEVNESDERDSGTPVD